jgi:hypothetical protein
MPLEEKVTPQKIHINDDLPTLYVDAVATRRRNDGFHYLSFTTNLPHCIVEQVRLMIDEPHLRRIIDDLCKAANYFPVKNAK